MHKDISLGLDLGEKYGVDMPMNKFIASKYEEAMAKYGNDSGSSIPCRLVEDASGCRLIDGESEGDGGFPGNTLAPNGHGGAFKDWSYTSEVFAGSYTIKHTGYDNVYLQPPFTEHATSGGDEEVVRLRARVKELEEMIGRDA